jgi:hypothetical protein
VSNEDDLFELIKWLSAIVAKSYECRLEAMSLPPEECKEYVMLNFPSAQGYRLNETIKHIGEQPTDERALARAMEIVWARLATTKPRDIK